MEGGNVRTMEEPEAEPEDDGPTDRNEASASKSAAPSSEEELAFWERTFLDTESSDNPDELKNADKCSAGCVRLPKTTAARSKRIKNTLILNAAMKTINSLPTSEEWPKKSAINPDKNKEVSNSLASSGSQGRESSKASAQSVAPRKAEKRAAPAKKSGVWFVKERRVEQSQSESGSSNVCSDSDCTACTRARAKGPPRKKRKVGNDQDDAASSYSSGGCSDSECSDCGALGFGKKKEKKKKKKTKKKKKKMKKKKKKKKKPCCC